MIMDTLKKEIRMLMQCSGFKEIEKQLQAINELIVTNYMFELSSGLRIYPIEVEAYFKDSKFDDESVHGNELQRNNYGRFYVHRTGITKKSKFKGGTRGGIDICLSDGADSYYGILIRSAKFNDGTTKFGPNNVLNFIIEDKKVDYATLEKDVVLKEAVEDCRDREHKSIILHSTRVGLSKKQSDDFKDLQLRTIVGVLLSSYPYKEKEKVFRNYIINESIPKEEAEKISVDILGYYPKALIKGIYKAL